MNTRVFVGDTRVDGVAADDRGLAYGDGLFETMRAHRGYVPWWDAHCRRLREGAQRLGIAVPEMAQVLREAMDLLAGRDAVLKLIVTRGGGGRGYAPANGAPTWILSTHPLPAQTREGIAVRWCDTRLAIQPALAGIKHCNRLEQVLARAEWAHASPTDREAQDGLMRSTDGDAVCATSANLFVLRDGRWLTPPVDRCGVAGICRGWAIEALQGAQARLAVTDVETADAVFLCNAVRGILPVTRLARRAWSVHPQIVALRERLADEHPGFKWA